MSDAERTVKLDLRDVPQSNLKKRPVLVVLQGPSLGLTIKVEKEQTLIGRGSQADLVLRDEIASRLHVEILRLDQATCVEYYISDLGSTNGTYLNGARLTAQQLLEDGDRVKVGNHVIKFAMLDEFEADFQERLHKMTQYDDLTGLRSRRSLFADLDRLINRAASTAETEEVSVLMMDLDHFKRVNDGRGHLVGSYTIRDVGQIISEIVGSVEKAARYGGEEYMAYVEGQNNGFKVAEAIRARVESNAFHASATDPTLTMLITISLGVASFPRDGLTALELVQKADQALYRAKLSGRNRTCVFDPEIDKPDSLHQMVDSSAIIYGPADAQ
ncbi:MAG TPA: GGDEF domain-containing protein [Blastocatellia bacterium]|nr:GGDEF domain-containing protein [Blastocatellia bacterium]